MRVRIFLLVLIAIIVTSCTTETTAPSVTDTAKPLPTETEEVSSPTAGATVTMLPSPSASPEPEEADTPASTTAPERTAPPAETPTLTPPAIDQAQLSLEGEVVVDGTNGRLFSRATYQGDLYTAALDAANGEVVALYPESGALAVDPIRHWLIVDQGNEGLVIRDVLGDGVVQQVVLPGTVAEFARPAAPLVMETSGDILAFRNSTVYRVEPISGIVEHLISFEEPVDVCGEPGDNPESISAGWWDDRSQILYLSFLSYVCTPWTGYTVRSYDVDAATVLAEEPGLSPFTAVVTEQGLVMRIFPRMGPGFFQRWRADGGGVTGDQQRHYGPAPLAYDSGRSGVYVLSGREMTLIDVVDLDVRGRATRAELGLAATDRLLGYDGVGDRLYVKGENGRLRVLGGGAVRALLETPVAPPAGPILPGTLHAAAGDEGVSLSAVWAAPECAASGVVFLGETVDGPWRNVSVNGTGELCDDVTALEQVVVGDDQQYLFALREGVMVNSFDEGLTWSPANAPAPATLAQVLPSPGYTDDVTIFGWSAETRTLYRSETGGSDWVAIRSQIGPAVLSFEFAADRTVATFGGGTVYISGNAGETWSETAPLPDGEQVAAVSLAPLWFRWGVLFAYTESGSLYRSLDRGASWAFMLRAGGEAAQFAYGPTEARREVFLLVEDGLHRSGDGGATWTYVGYPEGTAMALSPNFAADQILFLGTEFGDILAVDTASP